MRHRLKIVSEEPQPKDVIQLKSNPASQIRSEEKNVCVQIRALAEESKERMWTASKAAGHPMICKQAAPTMVCAVNVDQDPTASLRSWWSDSLC